MWKVTETALYARLLELRAPVYEVGAECGLTREETDLVMQVAGGIVRCQAEQDAYDAAMAKIPRRTLLKLAQAIGRLGAEQEKLPIDLLLLRPDGTRFEGGE